MREVKSRSDLSIDVIYIGSSEGPEVSFARKYEIPFYPISTGKFRRYFSWKNFLTPFQVGAGFFQSLRLLKHLRPDVVVSKGGYVSVPVVVASWILKIPALLHESDVSPGLANRICARFARVICVSWPETQRFFPGQRVLLTGIPVREEILHGDPREGLALTGFSGEKPILLVMGGSLGAEFLNELIVKMLPRLLKLYDVVHITGHITGQSKTHADVQKGYRYFEFLDRELAHIYAITDVVLSRSGAGTLAEIGALKKPSVLVPLGTNASRGDQILNAEKFEELGAAIVIPQECATPQKVGQTLLDLASNPAKRHQMGEHAYEFGVRCIRAASAMIDVIVSL